MCFEYVQAFTVNKSLEHFTHTHRAYNIYIRTTLHNTHAQYETKWPGEKTTTKFPFFSSLILHLFLYTNDFFGGKKTIISLCFSSLLIFVPVHHRFLLQMFNTKSKRFFSLIGEPESLFICFSLRMRSSTLSSTKRFSFV